MLEFNTKQGLEEHTIVDVFWEDKQKYDCVEIYRLFKMQEEGKELPKIISFTMRDRKYWYGGNYEENFIKQSVGKVFKCGVKQIYDIIFKKGLHLSCAKDQMFLTYEVREPFVWKKLEDFNLEVRNGKIFGNFEFFYETFYGMALTDYEIYNRRFPNDKEETIRFYGLFGSFILKREDDKIQNPCLYRDVEAVSHLGASETYGIEVNGEYHNFLANRIVVGDFCVED